MNNSLKIQYIKFCLYSFLKNLKFFDPFILLFFKESGFTYLKIGLLYSIKEIAMQVLEMPTGILADSLGRRGALIFAFISYIISFLLFFFTRDFFLFAISMIFFASGEAFRSGTHKAMIFQYLKNNDLQSKKIEVYGITRSWGQIGSAFSSLIAAVLVIFVGNYRIVFIGSVLPYIMGLILILTYPAEIDKVDESNDKNKLGQKTKNIKIILKQSFKDLKNINVLRSLLNASIFESFFKDIKDYLQPIINSFVLILPVLVEYDSIKRSSIFIGSVYFIIFIVSSYSSRKAASFSKKIGSDFKAINISYIFTALIFFLAGISLVYKKFEFTILFFLILYMIFNLRKPIITGYTADLVDQTVVATILSTQSQLKSIFSAFFAPFFGFLVDSFSIGSALMVISVIFILFLPITLVKNLNRSQEILS